MVKCTKCKKEKLDDEFKTCKECRDKANAKYAKKKALKLKRHDEQVQEAKFQIDLRKKDEIEAILKAKRNAKYAEANRFLNVDDIPALTIKQCSAYRYMMFGVIPKIPKFEKHLTTCQSCQDWQYRFNNGVLSSNDGEIYIPNKDELAELAPFGKDSVTCKQFREQYAEIIPRSEDFALVQDNHLPFCDACKLWVLAYDKKLEIELDTSTFGENRGETWKNPICSTCGAVLDKKGRCPVCQPNEESKAVQYQREVSNQPEAPKSEPEPEKSEPQQPQEPQRKSYNPDPDQWLRDHGG